MCVCVYVCICKCVANAGLVTFGSRVDSPLANLLSIRIKQLGK